MKKGIHWIIIAGAVILLIAAGMRFWGRTPEVEAETIGAASHVGQTAAAFQLTALDGKDYKVGGARDKPVLVHFWASWCGPCREEAPALEAAYEKYRKDIDFYAVNVTRADRLEEVKAFVQNYGLKFPILLDRDGKTAENYRILAIPTSFLVDRSGVIRDIFHPVPQTELERKIEAAVNAK